MPLIPAAAIVILLILAIAGGSARRADREPSKKSSRFTGRKSSDLITYDIVEDRVVQTPEQVRAAVSAKLGRPISINEVALAGAIASESSGPYAAQVGIGWAVKNYAARQGKSIFATVAPDGRFAAQGLPNHGYISTLLPPTKRTIEIAEGVLVSPPRIQDPTGGAIQFDSPKAQRALLAQGRVSKTPEEVAANRLAAGRREVHIPGVDPNVLRFWA